jgi:hypothetical protein
VKARPKRSAERARERRRQAFEAKLAAMRTELALLALAGDHTQPLYDRLAAIDRIDKMLGSNLMQQLRALGEQRESTVH